MTTLYRKYRPQTFGEIIGQKHIVQTLTNALRRNRVGQAYLFTGPRGTGKTTLARILARAVNCERRNSSLTLPSEKGGKSKEDNTSIEPCGKCPVCETIAAGRSLDIIEIDAASNTGVDNIRELRETVKLPPTQAKYKVYIIDEVHMLSTGAWNALLKTLEEPPSHVIFILATTEVHKVPETILSRVQRFDFVRLPMDNILGKLSAIAKAEKVKVEKEALEMIALAAEGGMRDAESLLGQILSLEDKEVTAAEVKEILGATDFQQVEEMGALILGKKLEEALKLLDSIAADGLDLEIFAKSLLNYLRQILIVSVDAKLAATFSYELSEEQLQKVKSLAAPEKVGVILRTIEAFLEAKSRVKSSFIPQLPLELALVKAIRPEIIENKSDPSLAPVEPAQVAPLPEKPRMETPKITIPAAPKAAAAAESEEKEEIAPAGKLISLSEIKERWNEVLSAVKPLNHSLILFLSNCQPIKMENNRLTITTQYSFYKDKLSERANKLTIEDQFAKLFGSRIRIDFTDQGYAASNTPAPARTEPEKSADPILSEAMKLFGGTIVEE